jgi:hypothetical protein
MMRMKPLFRPWLDHHDRGISHWSVLSSEEMDGNDGTREDTEDTTMFLQIEEVMCTIPVSVADRD